MARKISPKLYNEAQRTVKNFNAKVRYNKTKTRGKGMLPARLSLKTLLEKYSDKPASELRRQLKLYQSFGQRDALNRSENSRLSKWEKNFFLANREKTIKFYDDEIADLERIIGDQPQYHMRLHPRLQMLKDQRAELDKDLDTLTEDQIKGMRGYYNYAERSEIVKQRGFRLYLAQLERTMKELQYSNKEIDALFNKFNQLSENEFLEMSRNEDLIDTVYDLIDSPKGRGKFQLMTEEKRARRTIESIINQADDLISKYKTTK
jgi:hypothetical protein